MIDIYRGEDPDTEKPTAVERYVRDRVASSVSRATINYASLRNSSGDRLTESDVLWDWKQALLQRQGQFAQIA